jgi:hypothetical protein
MGESRKSRADSAHVAGGARIIPFPRRTLSRRWRGRRIVDPLRQMEDDEDRLRMRQNLAAALVVALLVTLGFWIIDHLRTGTGDAVCIEAGHQDCLPWFRHHS